jgi:RHS repeat-associated protein
MSDQRMTHNPNQTPVPAMPGLTVYPLLAARCALGILILCLGLAGFPAQAEDARMGLSVTLPNGYAHVAVEDLRLESTAGAVRWRRVWDGQEWKFNPHWESLSQSWKNLTGSQTADSSGGTIAPGTPGTGGGGISSGSGGCWVWVDEDWEPSAGSTVVGGAPKAGPMLPARTTPFNRVMGEADGDYPPPIRVSVDYASLCGGGSSTAVVDLEAVRRLNELYLGDAGRYAFSNRAVLEKREVLALPEVPAAELDTALAAGRIALAPVTVAKGFRWMDRDGAWIDYNTQGQTVAYGDRNGNPVWFARDADGIVRGVVDANGRVLFSLHYTGQLLTEVRDYPIAGNGLDLPARRVVYQYDDRNRLIQATDTRNHATRYDYDDQNHLVRITDPEGRIEQIEYKNGLVAKRIAPDDAVTDYVFEYDDTHKQFISKITGPATAAGRRVDDYTHNRTGKLVRRLVNGLTDEEVRYDTGARVELHTNARGFTTRITRDEFEQVVRIDYPDGSSRQRRYSPLHLELLEEIDEAGVKIQYEYDAKGNRIKKIEAAGTPDERVTEYQVNELGQTTRVTRKGRTEANGTATPDATWQIEYDPQGQIKKTIDPEDQVREYVIDRLGNLVRYTDPAGKIWRYTYDADGNPLTETDPLNHTTTYAYDKVGNPVSATDARNHTWRWKYDALNRETQSIDPYGAAYTTAYNGAGAPKAVEDASGKRMQLDYDALTRLTQATDSKGYTYHIDYAEADGTDKGLRRPSRVRYPTFQRLLRFDERERLTLKSDLDGEEGRVNSLTYDGVGRRKTLTDANGKTRYFSYNAHGQVAEIKDPMGNTLHLVHDARGNVIEVTDPNGNKTRLAYDRRNLLTRTTDPLGHSTHYGYDERGWLTDITQANGQSIAYYYDDAGRIIRHREFAAGGDLVKTVDYGYDEADNLTGWSDGSVSAVRRYDNADRLTAETIDYGGFSLTHSYTYYSNNQIKTYTGPDGIEVSYAFDGLGQLEQVTLPGEGSLAVTDWQWASPKKVLLPGGTVQHMDYDGYQSLTRLKVVNPGQVTVFDLQNQFGKLAELQRAVHDGNPLDYAYDDSARLTVVDAGEAVERRETYELDPAGNRIAHSRTGEAVWRYDAANQLVERGSLSYRYDAAGNQIEKIDARLAEPQRTTRYEYDAFNRLVQVTDGAGAVLARYTYDPFDRRLSKTLGDGAVTHYLPSAWGLLAEADHTGAVQVSYGWNPQLENGTAPLYARVPDGAGGFRYVYYHNDQLGTPQRLTDKAGNLVWAADYDGFGRATVRPAANAVVNNLRYPGQYFDAETGLHYNDRRYYDPDTGRYLTRDPIGFEGGINLYTYAAANPANFTDPTGEILPCLALNYLRCFTACMALGAAGDFLTGCEVDWGGLAKDCGLECLWDMLPIPNPCGKFGKFLSAAAGAIGGFNSFPAETPVQVRPAGAAASAAQAGQAELQPIGALQPGDEVLAWSEWKEPGSDPKADARLSYEKVQQVITSTREQHLVHLTLDSGETITATAGHPFRTREGWRDAILLKKGGQLLLKGGAEDDSERWATVAEVRQETRTVRVFNLEVANAHTFLVGKDGLVVHNANPLRGLPGIYEFPDLLNPGKMYVGKAADLADRTGKWKRRKRCKIPGIHPMPNSTELQRRIAEQKRINALGGVGSPGVSNITNPIDPSDWAKYGI